MLAILRRVSVVPAIRALGLVRVLVLAVAREMSRLAAIVACALNTSFAFAFFFPFFLPLFPFSLFFLPLSLFFLPLSFFFPGHHFFPPPRGGEYFLKYIPLTPHEQFGLCVYFTQMYEKNIEVWLN